jgi:hypothetical protein
MEEWVAELDYRPVACKKSYRLIVVRKRLEVEKDSHIGVGRTGLKNLSTYVPPHAIG